MDGELWELITCILCYSKDTKTCTYEDRRRVVALLHFAAAFDHAPKTKEEQEVAYAMFDAETIPQVALIETLPPEVLEGVTDLERYCWGYMTKKQRARLLAFYEKETGAPFRG